MPRHPNAVELTERRTWNARHYQNPDGTMSAEFSVGARHYRAIPGGRWLEKSPSFRAGPGNAEWISDESDVTMRTYQVGTGGNRRWWVEFKETLTGQGIAFSLDVQPTVTAGSDVLTFAGGWTYTHNRSGGKMLSPPIATKQGVQTHTFPYQLIGGAPPLVQNADGSVSCGNIFSMPRPYMEGANRINYLASNWS